MNADGSGQTRLTNNQADDHQPDWSPDGARIAFSSSVQDQNKEIYVMNADGTNTIRLTSDPGADLDPAWSPNGEKIVFSRDGGSEIYVMNADGTGQTNLTNNPASDALPDWQPLPQAPSPKNKAECKKGGYKTFGFKNQGQCIASLQKAAKKK
jgi:TolB protein